MTKRAKCCIICKLIVKPHTEQYRSGHNGHDWKSCVPQKGTEGSNPSCSAKQRKPVFFQECRFFLLSGQFVLLNVAIFSLMKFMKKSVFPLLFPLVVYGVIELFHSGGAFLLHLIDDVNPSVALHMNRFGTVSDVDTAHQRDSRKAVSFLVSGWSPKRISPVFELVKPGDLYLAVCYRKTGYSDTCPLGTI